MSRAALRAWWPAPSSRDAPSSISARAFFTRSARSSWSRSDASAEIPALVAAAVPDAVAATVFPSLTLSAVGTNAHYVLTWSVSNSTFNVREVIP